MIRVASTKGIDAALVSELMMLAVENRMTLMASSPNTLNGSPTTAAETRSFSKQLGLKPVSSPQSNCMTESFVQTLKSDFAKLADRPDSQTVMAQLTKWFDDYNSQHSHSALGYMPPKLLFWEKRAIN